MAADLPFSSRLVFSETDPQRSFFFQDGHGRWFRLRESVISRLKEPPADSRNDMIQVSFRDGLAEMHAKAPFRIFHCDELLAEALALWTSYLNPRFREMIVAPYIPPLPRHTSPSADPLGLNAIFPELAAPEGFVFPQAAQPGPPPECFVFPPAAQPGLPQGNSVPPKVGWLR